MHRPLLDLATLTETSVRKKWVINVPNFEITLNLYDQFYPISDFVQRSIDRSLLAAHFHNPNQNAD